MFSFSWSNIITFVHSAAVRAAKFIGKIVSCAWTMPRTLIAFTKMVTLARDLHSAVIYLYMEVT